MRNSTLSLALITTLGLVGCGDDKGASETDATTDATTDASTTAGTTDATAGTTDATATATTDATGSASGTATSTAGTASTTDGTAGTTDATTTAGTTDGTTTAGTTDATTTTGGVDGDPAKYSESCAPDDGPATEFSIGIAERACLSDFPDDAPILRITLFQGVSLKPGDYPIDGGYGFVYYDVLGTVTYGNAGTLTIDTVTTDGLVGSYDVTLMDNTQLTGSFDAIYCPQDVLCG